MPPKPKDAAPPADATATAEPEEPPNVPALPPDAASQPMDPSTVDADKDRPIFVCSQIGGSTVINYGYTDLPWTLLAWDVYYFFYYIHFLPWIVMPITPHDSGALSELAPTWANLWCVAVHAVLVVLQVGFLLCLPLAFLFPLWYVALSIAGFLVFNNTMCYVLLNGKRRTYCSDEKYAPRLPEHAGEQWIFVNGVAVGEHWLKNNLNRLALTFKRPILGIHNRTHGIIFDVIECLVQRSLGYATCDTRICYALLKEKLYDPSLTKVVLILHSQGGIEGGLVVDWVLQELPQDLLAKLEVYTFACAANHFNNPHRHIVSQKLAENDPGKAVDTVTSTITIPTPDHDRDHDHDSHKKKSPELPKDEPAADEGLKTMQTQAAAYDRAITHIEHYAHMTDFVALWGVLHFATSALASNTVPRFIGRLFIRSSRRGGHQLVQHYLDGMFPLERDPDTGEFLGAAEENGFMESVVQLGIPGDASEHVREALEISWTGDQGGFGSGSGSEYGGDGGGVRDCAESVSSVDVHCAGTGTKLPDGLVRVKDVSRLWLYRNGKIPHEIPSMITKEPQQQKGSK